MSDGPLVRSGTALRSGGFIAIWAKLATTRAIAPYLMYFRLVGDASPSKSFVNALSFLTWPLDGLDTPQWGQLLASELISFPHSRHGTSAIRDPYAKGMQTNWRILPHILGRRKTFRRPFLPTLLGKPIGSGRSIRAGIEETTTGARSVAGRACL